MEVVVPSVHDAASSPVPVSFYNQERFEVVPFYANSKFFTRSLDSATDTCDLDDRAKERSLMNTTHHTTAGCMSADFSVAAQLDHGDSVTNPTSAALHMEPTVSLDRVMGLSDSRCQCSNVNCICQDVDDLSSHTAITSTLPAAACVPACPQTMKCVDTVATSPDVCQKQLAVTTNVCQKQPAVVTNVIENTASLRTHFPQRAYQPQIGVAAVIQSTVCPRQKNNGLQTIKFSSQELNKFVSITSPQSESENLSSVKAYDDRRKIALQIRNSSEQIVPSSSVTKRANVSILQTGIVSSEILASEESTDEKWKHVKNFMGSPLSEPSAKRRKRMGRWNICCCF